MSRINDRLPYEDKVVELQKKLFSIFDNEDVVLFISSCVSDYEEDVDELLRFMNNNSQIPSRMIVEYAYDILQARELGERD